MIITLKPFQSRYVQSEAKYPAFVGGWATGKSLCLIGRMFRLMDESPKNLGVIVRKDYTDLHDSTIKDTERYTGLTVNANKEIHFRNGSVLMFRHGKELDVLKNTNLGCFAMEQAEEFETDDQFIYLMGRLRRKEAKRRQGMIIANANGHNWIFNWWKNKETLREMIRKIKETYPDYALTEADFDLTEATTYDNADNLPADYLASLEVIKFKNPQLYNRFVMNSYDEEDTILTMIKNAWVERAISGILVPYSGHTKRYTSYDPAGNGGDLNVIYAWHNNRIVAEDHWQQSDISRNGSLVSASRAITFNQRHKGNAIVIWTAGIGDIIADIIAGMGGRIYKVNEAERSNYPARFANIKAEVWSATADKLAEGLIGFPADDSEMGKSGRLRILKEDLTQGRYGIVRSGSNIQIRIEGKPETRKRLGRSQDSGDACVLGAWYQDKAEPIKTAQSEMLRGYKRNKQRRTAMSS